MQAKSSSRSALLNLAFTLLFGIGIVIAGFGIWLDYLLPQTNLGFGYAQLSLVATGLMLSLFSIALRRSDIRRRLFQQIGSRSAVVMITIVTLIFLEFLMHSWGFPTYYPTYVPQRWLEPAPWWTCDKSGCRYVYDEVIAACERGDFSGRQCIVNWQGFRDTQDFAAVDITDTSARILIMGDSFTAGFTAEIGKSYVETIEANFPDSIVWNTGISVTGTNNALASFETYAPLLQPQIAILGFTMNDYEDNTMPVESHFVGVDLLTNKPIRIHQFRIDMWGNLIKLDPLTDLYYRRNDVEPPASEIKRQIGMTRLGTLVLRLIDKIGAILFEDARFNTKVDITRNYLRDLRDASAEQDSALLVVLIPREDNVDTVSVRYQTAIDLMQELGIPYINPIDALGADDYVPPPDGHWNSAGHQKIGAMLSACLESFFVSENIADCEHVEKP